MKKFKALKKFGVQDDTTGNIVWYDKGKAVPEQVVGRLSAHSAPYLVEDITPKRKTNAKNKKPAQRKSRKQSPKK